MHQRIPIHKQHRIISLAIPSEGDVQAKAPPHLVPSLFLVTSGVYVNEIPIMRGAGNQKQIQE